MPDQKKSLPDERSAIKWPEAEYREWVQTNISNKMFGRLATGGVATISLAGGLLYWIQESSINTLQLEARDRLRETVSTANDRVSELEASLRRQISEIETRLQRQMDYKMDDRIISALSNNAELKSNLVNSAKDQLNEYIGSTEYREEAKKAIIQDQTLEELVRERGIDIAQATDGPTDSRKLGLQLYGLFQPTDGTEHESFRTNLIAILEAEPGFSDLTGAILDLYKFQACEDFGFISMDNVCKSNDRRAVTAAVAHYTATSDDAVRQDIGAWLAGMPLAHSYILTNELAKELDATAEPLLRALAGSRRADLIERVAVEISQRMAPNDRNGRDLMLAFLSWLPDDLPLTRQARIDFALWIWKHADLEEMQAAFAPVRIDNGDDPSSGVRPSPLRQAVVNMLRVDGEVGAEDGGIATDRENDWDAILRSALELGRYPDRDALLLNAWASRINLEHERHDVHWAARRMLRHYKDDTLAAPLEAYAAIMPHADWPDVEAFANAFVDRTPTLHSDDPILQAILAQDRTPIDAHSKPAFQWLDRQAAADPTRRLPLLTSAVFHGQDLIPGVDTHQWNRALALAAAWQAGDSPDPSAEVLALMCREEVKYRLRDKDKIKFWRMVNAVEDVLLIDRGSPDNPLRLASTEFMPWLGQPPGGLELAVEADEPQWQLAAPSSAAAFVDQGGAWRLATVTSESWVVYTPPPDVTLSAFDTGMTRLLGTSEPGQPLELRLEAKQRYLVVARPLDQAGQPGVVEIRQHAILPPVTANTRERAYAISSAVRGLAFSAGESGGEAWFSATIPANHRIDIQTSARPDSPANLDTIVYLLGAPTGEQLAVNDDGPGLGYFSRLQHTAWSTRDVLVRVAQIGDRPFAAGAAFNIDMGFEPAPAPTPLSSLPAEMTFVATESAPEALYRLSLDAGQSVTVQTGGVPDGQDVDTVVYLLDAASGSQLDWNDDGPELGLYSRASFTAPGPTDLIVRVVEIGNRPFAPGTSFNVEVDVSPGAG